VKSRSRPCAQELADPVSAGNTVDGGADSAPMFAITCDSIADSPPGRRAVLRCAVHPAGDDVTDEIDLVRAWSR